MKKPVIRKFKHQSSELLTGIKALWQEIDRVKNHGRPGSKRYLDRVHRLQEEIMCLVRAGMFMHAATQVILGKDDPYLKVVLSPSERR
jgi:hypothetical protein